MKNVYIKHKNEYMDEALQDTSSLGLILTDENLEIMYQSILKKNTGCIEQGEDDDLMEFFYILEGTVIISNDEEKHTLTVGDSFYIKGLKESIGLETTESTRMLYITTKPVFNMIKQYSTDLTVLLKKIEDNDLYTQQHSDRVQKYSYAIASKLNLSQKRIDNLLLASLFHDLGKYAIPVEILHKPGKLTNDEFVIIKQHPKQSAILLLEKFNTTVARIAEQHHEKIDGTGYPYGLTGDEICLESKIICVADSYDAMTSDRPYRKAMTPEQAIQELQRCKGSQFDEQVVDTFIEVLKEEKVLDRE